MVALFGTFNNQCTFFVGTSADDVFIFRSKTVIFTHIVRSMWSCFVYTLPPRTTLALSRAVPPLILQGERCRFKPPRIEGSCRRKSTEGWYKIFKYQQRNVDCIVKYRNVLKITQKRGDQSVAPHCRKNYSSPSSIASLCESDILPVFLSTSITLTFSQSPSLTTSSTFSTL